MGLVAEVLESQATGKIKTVYDDLKATLRIPFVSPTFRMLASYPDYLQMAWLALKPNVQIAYFEHWADAVRAAAVETVADLGGAPSAPAEATPALEVFHYANPKLFLALAALRAATNGQQPRLQELPRDEKRQIVRGVPPAMSAVRLTEPTQHTPQVQQIFDQMEATRGTEMGEEMRVLAQWPDYLETALRALEPLAQQQAYRQLQVRVRRAAEEAIVGLPYRMDLNPHVMRQIGISEQQLDAIHAILRQAYHDLPPLIADTAFLSLGIEGKEKAAQSPFPVGVL